MKFKRQRVKKRSRQITYFLFIIDFKQFRDDFLDIEIFFQIAEFLLEDAARDNVFDTERDRDPEDLKPFDLFHDLLFYFLGKSHQAFQINLALDILGDQIIQPYNRGEFFSQFYFRLPILERKQLVKHIFVKAGFINFNKTRHFSEIGFPIIPREFEDKIEFLKLGVIKA